MDGKLIQKPQFGQRIDHFIVQSVYCSLDFRFDPIGPFGGQRLDWHLPCASFSAFRIPNSEFKTLCLLLFLIPQIFTNQLDMNTIFNHLIIFSATFSFHTTWCSSMNCLLLSSIVTVQ
jgi:hypothetical protein